MPILVVIPAKGSVAKVHEWDIEIAARFFESAPWGQARNDMKMHFLSLRGAQRRSNLVFGNKPEGSVKFRPS